MLTAENQPCVCCCRKPQQPWLCPWRWAVSLLAPGEQPQHCLPRVPILGGWELCCVCVLHRLTPPVPPTAGLGRVGAPCWGAGGLQAPAASLLPAWGWGPATPTRLCCPTHVRGSVLLPGQLFPQLSVSSVLLQLPSLVSQVYRSAFGLWVSDCHLFPNPTSQPAVGISMLLKFPK